MSKIFLLQTIKFRQTFLIQTIQFSIRIVFVYTQLNVKAVVFETIQFSLNTVSMSKIVLVQAIEFSIQITVLFQAIQFSISTQFSSIWLIDQVLPLQARVDLGVMAIKGYSAFPKAPALLEPHILSYPGQSLGGGLTPLQRSSWCILQTQLTGQNWVLVVGKDKEMLE